MLRRRVPRVSCLAKHCGTFGKPNAWTAAIIYYGIARFYGSELQIWFMRVQAALPMLNVHRRFAQTGLVLLESCA